MKRLLFLSVLYFFLSRAVLCAQTTATNFTANDCYGTAHTLFTELDAGKIIVLVWVEPCGGCISDAKAGYDAARSFATAYPGRVQYWLVDDAGNTSCSALSSWATTSGINPLGATIFDNAGNLIDEANYGGYGMPHVVVLGDTSHYIYYNKMAGSGDGADISAAINQALTGTTQASTIQPTNNYFKVYPNPASGKISVQYDADKEEQASFTLYDAMGSIVEVFTSEMPAGARTLQHSFSRVLPNGLYFLQMANQHARHTEMLMIRN